MALPTHIEIGGRKIGPGEPAFLIAEVAQSHDGSLGLAHAFIDAAARAGADAIKFQTHIAAAESTLDEPFRVKFSRQDDTRYAYWQRMEFTAEQWAGLADHAHEKNLIFLSSAFSLEAVELLERIGMPAWKVGSGEFRSLPLLERMLATGAPMLYSTGMSKWAEIDDAVSFIGARGRGLALLQCTSKYPTPLEQAGLNVIADMQRRYLCPAGLSDHSGQIWPALAAMARGASLIEAHIAFDRMMFGPDVPASLTVDEFRQVADGRNAFARMDGHPVDKDALADELGAMRNLFTKSVGLTRALEAGTILSAEMMTAKKPGTGIPADQIPSLVGRRLRRPVTPERLLTIEDLDA